MEQFKLSKPKSNQPSNYNQSLVVSQVVNPAFLDLSQTVGEALVLVVAPDKC